MLTVAHQPNEHGQHLGPDGATRFGLLVEDLDAAHRRALDAGAAEYYPPVDKPWKPRSSCVVDPSDNREAHARQILAMWAFVAPAAITRSGWRDWDRAYLPHRFLAVLVLWVRFARFGSIGGGLCARFARFRTGLSAWFG